LNSELRTRAKSEGQNNRPAKSGTSKIIDQLIMEFANSTEGQGAGFAFVPLSLDWPTWAVILRLIADILPYCAVRR